MTLAGKNARMRGSIWEQASLYGVGWEQVHLAIGEECRAEARLLVDGLGVLMAENATAWCCMRG